MPTTNKHKGIVTLMMSADNKSDMFNLTYGGFNFDSPIQIPSVIATNQLTTIKPKENKPKKKCSPAKKNAKPNKATTKPRSPRKCSTTAKIKPAPKTFPLVAPIQSKAATSTYPSTPSPTTTLLVQQPSKPASLAYDIVELGLFHPFQPSIPNPILKSPSMLSLASLPFSDLCSLGSLKDDFIRIMEDDKEEDKLNSPMQTISVPNPLSIPTITTDNESLSTHPSIGTYRSQDLYICPLFPGPEMKVAFNSEFHPRHESTLPDNLTYCVACKCNIFDCSETKYGPYVVTQIEQFFEYKTCVSRRMIADKYFKVYNHLMNAIAKVEKVKHTVKFDRDPPICMFVNSYRRVLALSNYNDSDDDK